MPWTYENSKGETVIEQSLDDVFEEADREVEATYKEIRGQKKIQKDYNGFFKFLNK